MEAVLDFSSVGIFVGCLAPVAAMLLAGKWDEFRRRHEKPPQQEKLLRPPGYSLMQRLDDVFFQIVESLGFAMAMGGLAGVTAAHGARIMVQSRADLATWIIALFLVVSCASAIALTIKCFRLWRQSRNIKLGLRGEQAVAEALNEVGDHGFRAFHDIPGSDNWNIDHVVVGPRGVFVIETKARRRRGSKTSQREHEVVFDSKDLRFPFGTDNSTVPQIRRNIGWTTDYLAKKTGEAVRVEGIIALPGWFVAASGNFDIKVMNCKGLVKYLQGRQETIPPAQVRRLITALEEKCRTLEF